MKKLFLLSLAALMLAGCGGDGNATGLSTDTSSTPSYDGPTLGLIRADSADEFRAGNFTKVEGEMSQDPSGNVQFAVMNQIFTPGQLFAIHNFKDTVDLTNHSVYEIENGEEAYNPYVIVNTEQNIYAAKANFKGDFYIKASKEESGRKVWITFTEPN